MDAATRIAKLEHQLTNALERVLKLEDELRAARENQHAEWRDAVVGQNAILARQADALEALVLLTFEDVEAENGGVRTETADAVNRIATRVKERE